MSFLIKMLKLLLLLLVMIISSSKSSLNYRPGGRKMLIYGLYQSCKDEDLSHVMKNITQEADVCRKSVEWIDFKKMEINDAIIKYHNFEFANFKFPDHLNWNMSDIEYKSLEFCSSQDLTNIVVNLLLNEENFIKLTFGKTPENMWNGIKIYLSDPANRYPDTRILAILLYADILSSTAVHLLINSKFPIYHLKSGWMPPLVDSLNFKKDKIISEKPNSLRFIETIERTLRRKKTNYFTILYFKGRNFIHEEKYKEYRLFLEQQSDFCFDAYEVDSSEKGVNTTINVIKLNERIKVVMTFGDSKKQFLFFNEAISQGVHKISWIFQDVNIVNKYFPHGMPSTTEAAFISNTVLLYDYINELDLFEKVLIPDSSNADGYKKEIVFLCKMKMVSLINGFISGLWKLIYRRTKYTWYELFHRKFREYTRKVFIGRTTMKSILIEKNRGKPSFSFRFSQIEQNTSCVVPICQVGHHLRSLYNHSYYGPNCVQCSNIYYKSEIGNTHCQPCPKYMISTTNRDSCYDPYKEIFPSLNQWSTLISLFINGCGGMFSLFAILIFLYQQDTPLVRAMDFKISILHLISLLLTFIVTPYLFIMKPVSIVCIVRPLCISVLNNLSVAFVIAKSHRLLSIFKSKLKVLSEGEMRRYNAYVGTGIFLICGIGQAFLLLPASKIKPEAKEIRMDKQMVRDIYCNTEDYINIQLGYLILLQLFTSFQAFKCRSLPGPFNEAMPIVYSTLIVIATYSVTFPIYYFQHIESMKANVHFISLSVANLFPMLILYGNRLYIVVFKRKKNSKNYVRKRIWTFSSE